MCFSAQASFAASGILSLMGVLTIRAARKPELRLIASVPLFFALQQFLEGVLWVTLMRGETDSFIHYIALYGFLFFAGVFWPTWIPALIYKLEHSQHRRNILKGFLSAGAFISVFYLIVMVVIGSGVENVGNHLSYPYPTDHFEYFTKAYGQAIYYFLLILYVSVIVGSCFTSSLPKVWIFGFFVGIGLLIAYIFYALSLGSVWCYFAALISAVLYFVVRK